MNAAHLEVCASPEWRQFVEETVIPEALTGADLGPDVIEIGPGPGLTTDFLRHLVEHLTAVELDPDLASALESRSAGSNVEVICCDASSLAFPSGSFTGAASFHMLHHIETDEIQDKVLAELARVLKPGGTLVAADGVDSEASRAFHEDDTYNPIDPNLLGRRLTAAGFTQVQVRATEIGWVCRATRA